MLSVLACVALAGSSALIAPATRPRCPPTCCTASRADLLALLERVAARRDEVVVVKFGGHAMTNLNLFNQFAKDISLLQSLGMRPIVVHGGGPQIGKMLERLQIQSQFKNGLRVTDQVTMQVVEMVLCGSLNKQIASAINTEGGRAVGISGKDDAMVTAAQVDPELGLVGEPAVIRISLLENLIAQGIVPVLAPVAIGECGATYNLNADTMAGAIAGALKAQSLLLLTDVAGVLGSNGLLLPSLTLSAAQGLVSSGVATGGMIPKISNAIQAIEGGVESAVIADGRVPHCTLEHLFGENPVGTSICG